MPQRTMIESLEPRTLLAGDVHVFLDSKGHFIVTGDGAANGIQLDQYGEFVIQGVDAGGAPTRVNGVENGIAVFPATGNRDIRIQLKGGDDTIEVGVRSDSVSPPHDLSIDTGAGNDSALLIGDTNVGHNLVLAGGSGRDTLFIVGVQIGNDVEVTAGDGDDILEIYGSDIADDLSINAGAGKDTVSIGLFNGPAGRVEGAVTVHDSTAIDLGKGNDALELVASTFTGTFRADAGNGSDTLTRDLLSVFGQKPAFKKFEVFLP